jgi:S1-C subfamily serine protease
MKGDVLMSVNGQEVTSGETLAASLRQVAPGGQFRIQLARGQETLVKTMTMPDSRVNMFGAFLQSGTGDLVQVGEVSPNTPAEKAGLLKGDVIISMAGQRPRSLADLSAFVAKLVANDKSADPIELQVQRPRELRPVTLIIERVPAPALPPSAPAPRGVPAAEPGAMVLGVEVSVQGNRVTVVKPMPQGPAAAAGILPGDVLLGVGKKPIDSFAALSAAVAGHRPGDEVLVDLQRANKAGSIRVTAIQAGPNSPPDVVLHGGQAGVPATVPAQVQTVPAQVQTGVQIEVPAGVPAEGSDVATLRNEVRMLRARVEALEQLVKQLTLQPNVQRNRQPVP